MMRQTIIKLRLAGWNRLAANSMFSSCDYLLCIIAHKLVSSVSSHSPLIESSPLSSSGVK